MLAGDQPQHSDWHQVRVVKGQVDLLPGISRCLAGIEARSAAVLLRASQLSNPPLGEQVA